MTEDQVYAELGRRIRIIRKWRGLRQEDLAAKMLMVRASITNAEMGRQHLPIWTLIRLSFVLNVPPHVWLLMPNDWSAWCRSENVTNPVKEVRIVSKTVEHPMTIVRKAAAA